MKLTVKDLKQLHEDAAKALALRQGPLKVKISVHMGDCGVEAGAREVMDALLEDLAALDRPDIQVFTAGCIEKCDKAPIVTVEVEGAPQTQYQRMDAEKMRRVLNEHVLQGRVPSDLVLSPA